MKNFFSNLIKILFIVLFLDLLCFGAWIASNQKPIGDVYFGMITGNVLKAILVEEKTPCSFPDPQFSNAQPEDYNTTDCEIEFIEGGEIK